VLSAKAVEFLAEQSKDKLPRATLFTENGETPWRRHVWAKAVRSAIAKRNEDARENRRISTDASACSFRPRPYQRAANKSTESTQ
jgi:hypothetical protein